MPWRETCVQEQRVRFIHDWQKREDTMAELCRRHGVSRRIGYKWVGRYEQGGLGALQDRPRAPQRHPNQPRPRSNNAFSICAAPTGVGGRRR